MASVLCIYGTTSGNTELVVEKVAEVLRSKKHAVETKRAERSSASDIQGHDLYILAASTYGHGILQDYMIPVAKELKKTDLSGKRFAVIGLGDTKYDAEYHIESARILEKIISGANGERVCASLKVSKSPIPHLETTVKKWAKDLSKILLQKK